MKYRYYITDLIEGVVVGTNSRAIADHFAASDDYFVVDAQNGLWLQSDEEFEINEAENWE
ncbi:MAG: hypothetical protein IPK63_18455 [Candidatus Competibacteraceae bacterium]|nr:hypothetical protein [Candidatus Competibacteraceae bacterium]